MDRIEGRHGQLYSDTGRLQYSLSIMGRTTTQKIEKEIQHLNNPVEQLYLTDIQSTALKKKNYTFLPSVPGTFSRINHKLVNKTSLNKFEEMEIMQSIFSPITTG